MGGPPTAVPDGAAATTTPEAILLAAVGTLPDVGALAASLESSVAHLSVPQRDTALVTAIRAVRPVTQSWLRAHGATSEQAADSVADVDRKLGRYGLRGTGLDWFCSVLTARVVAVGRLQFEMGVVTSDGHPAWGVHVPEGGPLVPDDCDRSFAAAPELLAELTQNADADPDPDADTDTDKDTGTVAERWQCRSWFLDPGLPAVLGPRSNTARFASRFRLDPGGPDDAAEGDDSVAKFVFGTTLAAARRAVPRNRLETAVLDRWRAGEHWTVRTGTAPVDPA
ncbi:hypothetical protein SAMN02800687_0373 [Curtobacterium sp. UNCCL20]|uniref:hypothetical protein n=1 Tax=Curtobacterium sp. UNCCL20 TaxID=1502773 RepID=UPI00088BB479|nr:hypothetical protein [Curtobacterium sp. UNCCL20]SDQ11296.1 hypothetical protein SAMN02800687_0373 [Curtobacterium sp. UNCCL20]